MLAVVTVSPVRGQSGNDAVFNELQTHAMLGPDDDPVLDVWLVEVVEQLVTASKGGIEDFAQKGKEARVRVETLVRDADVSEAFKTHLAQRAAAQFNDRFAGDNPAPAVVARALVRLLRAMDRIETLPALQAATRSDDPAVRFLAVEGHRDLGDRMGRDAQLSRATITSLGDVGMGEESGVIVGAVYRAVQIPNFTSESLSTMIDVLNARARRFQQGRNIPELAEFDAYVFLNQNASQLTQAQRAQVAGDVAAFLKYYVGAYSSPLIRPADKHLLETLIFPAEALLETLVAPNQRAPSLRTALRDRQDTAQNLPVELAKWIGATGSPGLLNQPPWSLPIGAESPTPADEGA